MTWNAGLYFYALLLLGWGIGLSVGVMRLHHPGPQYPESNELSPIANILLTVSRGTPRVAFTSVGGPWLLRFGWEPRFADLWLPWFPY